jgi:hypothetical protein
MSYRQKYLKYKQKYLELKKIYKIGGIESALQRKSRALKEMNETLVKESWLNIGKTVNIAELNDLESIYNQLDELVYEKENITKKILGLEKIENDNKTYKQVPNTLIGFFRQIPNAKKYYPEWDYLYIINLVPTLLDKTKRILNKDQLENRDIVKFINNLNKIDDIVPYLNNIRRITNNYKNYIIKYFYDIMVYQTVINEFPIMFDTIMNLIKNTKYYFEIEKDNSKITCRFVKVNKVLDDKIDILNINLDDFKNKSATECIKLASNIIKNYQDPKLEKILNELDIDLTKEKGFQEFNRVVVYNDKTHFIYLDDSVDKKVDKPKDTPVVKITDNLENKPVDTQTIDLPDKPPIKLNELSERANTIPEKTSSNICITEDELKMKQESFNKKINDYIQNFESTKKILEDKINKLENDMKNISNQPLSTRDLESEIGNIKEEYRKIVKYLKDIEKLKNDDKKFYEMIDNFILNK